MCLKLQCHLSFVQTVLMILDDVRLSMNTKIHLIFSMLLEFWKQRFMVFLRNVQCAVRYCIHITTNYWNTCTCRSHLNTGVLTHNTKLSTFPDSYQIFCFISSQETMQNKANWIHWDQRKQFVISGIWISLICTHVNVYKSFSHISLLMYNVVFIHFNIHLLLIVYITSDRGGLGDTWV